MPNEISHQRRHRNDEKVFWGMYIFISTMTLFATSIAAMFAGGAYRVAQQAAPRAWLFFETNKAHSGPFDHDLRKGYYEATILGWKIQNYGQVPATIHKTYAKMICPTEELQQLDLTKNFDPDNPPPRYVTQSSFRFENEYKWKTLGNGQSIEDEHPDVLPTMAFDFPNFLGPPGDCVVSVRIEYEDPYGRDRVTSLKAETFGAKLIVDPNPLYTYQK